MREDEHIFLCVGAVIAIARRFHSVRAFALKMHQSTSDAGVAALAAGCPNLTVTHRVFKKKP
jgi:hypothetical protein